VPTANVTTKSIIVTLMAQTAYTSSSLSSPAPTRTSSAAPVAPSAAS
jgi:hypothetical protein